MEKRKNDISPKHIVTERQNSDEIVGEKFEDLSDEAMKKIQGSGSDVQPEDLTKSWAMITSEAPYQCR